MRVGRMYFRARVHPYFSLCMIVDGGASSD
jgi:hypothetical protein